jgi:UDP-sulfoquinovose synthase
VEQEQHFYLAKHTRLLDLGLEPHLLDDETIGHLLDLALRYRDRINLDTIPARVRWRPERAAVEA